MRAMLTCRKHEVPRDRIRPLPPGGGVQGEPYRSSRKQGIPLKLATAITAPVGRREGVSGSFRNARSNWYCGTSERISPPGDNLARSRRPLVGSAVSFWDRLVTLRRAAARGGSQLLALQLRPARDTLQLPTLQLRPARDGSQLLALQLRPARGGSQLPTLQLRPRETAHSCWLSS